MAPTLLDPLPTERAVRDRVDPDIWRDFVTQPVGTTIEQRFTDDTVRGVVATDALIGPSRPAGRLARAEPLPSSTT